MAHANQAPDENRYTHLGRKNRKHMLPYRTDWTQCQSPLAQVRQKLAGEPRDRKKVQHPQWTKMPFIEEPGGSAWIDINVDANPTPNQKDNGNQEECKICSPVHFQAWFPLLQGTTEYEAANPDQLQC